MRTLPLLFCFACSACAIDDDSAARRPVIADGESGDEGGDEDGCAGAAVDSVSARVVDEDGAGLVGARLQLCVTASDGRNACLRPAAVDVDGAVTVAMPDNARCLSELSLRVLAGEDRVPLHCAAEIHDGAVDVGALAVGVVAEGVFEGGLTASGGITGAALDASSCVHRAAPDGTWKLWALTGDNVGDVVVVDAALAHADVGVFVMDAVGEFVEVADVVVDADGRVDAGVVEPGWLALVVGG